MNRRRCFHALAVAALIMPFPAAQGIAAAFDPRAHGDLSPVIFLCATEPGSARFDTTWVSWLEDNPDADVDGAIHTVLSRAGTVRSMAIPGIAPSRPGSWPDPDAIAAHMTALARRARSAAATTP